MALRTGPTRVVTTIVVAMMWLGRVLPFVEITHYAHHAESCDDHVWEEPLGWPDLLPVLW